MPSFNLKNQGSFLDVYNKSECKNAELEGCFECECNIQNDIYKSKDPFDFLENEKDSVYQREDMNCKTEKSKEFSFYEDVELNDDLSPKLIRKKTCQKIEYVQEIFMRYLSPPSPPPAGLRYFWHKEIAFTVFKLFLVLIE